jgi:diguanylate cyclase (GGDEF)-like protein
METENKYLRKFARTDKLTGLNNRAGYDEHMSVQINLASRMEKPLSIIVVDLDYFKNVNDTYGHTFGDNVLKTASKILDGKSRKSDIVCRFGGEEFVLILPETTSEGAAALAEKMRKAFEKTIHKMPDNEVLKVTASFGVASFSKNDTSQTLFDKADKAVYFSKENGRNMVKINNKVSKRKMKVGIFERS